MAQAPQLNDSQLNLLAKIAANTGETQPKHGDGQHNLLFKIAQNTYASAVNGANIEISDVSGLQSELDSKSSTSHKSTHATGGSDALTPSDIGAQSIFESEGFTLSANVTLTSSRAKTWTVGMFVSSTFDITLPTSGIQVGDILVIKAGTTFNGTAVIKRSATQVTTMGTLLAGRSFRFIATSTADTGWVADGTYTHTHAIADTTGLQDALDGKLGLSANSYVVARPGDNLATKYGEAKVLTPQGNSRSATNRAALIIISGSYPLSSELAIDTDFVDIVGLGAQHQSPAVIISNNTLNVTANDVRVSGISVGSQAFKTGDNKANQRFDNCSGGSNSFVGNSTASGKFTNCSGGSGSFGGGGTPSGEFISCRLVGAGASYPTLSGSGIIRFCLDGDNNIVNADAP